MIYLWQSEMLKGSLVLSSINPSTANVLMYEIQSNSVLITPVEPVDDYMVKLFAVLQAGGTDVTLIPQQII